MSTTRAVTTVTRAGLDTVGAAADATGDEWPNTGQEYIEIKNGGGGAITVTLNIQALLDGQAAVNPTVTVNAAQTKIIGPFPTALYNNTATGRAKVTYSGVASVTIVCFKNPPG